MSRFQLPPGGGKRGIYVVVVRTTGPIDWRRDATFKEEWPPSKKCCISVSYDANDCYLEIVRARPTQPPFSATMRRRSAFVTSSRFERRLPGGRHDRLFKVVFGSDAVAARYFRVSRMTVWRWRHDRSPLPSIVADVLSSLVQSRVAEAHVAQNELNYYLREPPKPPRPLSRCCAGLHR